MAIAVREFSLDDDSSVSGIVWESARQLELPSGILVQMGGATGAALLRQVRLASCTLACQVEADAEEIAEEREGSRFQALHSG